MIRRFSRALVIASALMAGAVAAAPAWADTVKIYAAAVVKTPLSELAADYQKETGNTVTVIYDSAGSSADRFKADADADVEDEAFGESQ